MSPNRADLESRVVWLFGSPRSGSTWLVLMASRHPSIVNMDEPLIGYHLSPFLSNEPGYRVADLDLDTFTMRRVLEDQPHKFFATEYRDVWVRGLRRLLNDRLRAHLLSGPSGTDPATARLIVKEPNGSQSADVIMRAQPRAGLLFLLRDGRDVVDSDLAGVLEGGWQARHYPHMRGIGESERLDFVTRAAHQWLWRTEVVEAAFAHHRGPKHMLRYEDLLRDTPRHLSALFEWLELPLDAAQVAAIAEDYAFERRPHRGPKQFVRFGMPGAWRENLRPQEREAVERIMGAKLRELGYELDAPAAATTGAGTRAASTGSRRPSATEPQRGKLEAIDYAIEELGIESFASLAVRPVDDQYGFHMIDKPGVERGTLVDVRGKRPRAQLLSAIEQAAEHPGLHVLEGPFTDPRTVAEIGKVDALLLLDVLLRLVDPAWDRVLELYAPSTSCFVIANPQWEGGQQTVRLIDLGRERFLDVAPPSNQHRDLFDRLDEWNAGQQRPHRDTLGIWQWGITDADLAAKMGELGFSLEREWSLNKPRGTEGFVNRMFVFSRAGMRGATAE